MKFICYPKCTTCKKAQAWLDSKGLTYEVRDIKTENPTEAEISAWYKKSGLPSFLKGSSPLFLFTTPLWIFCNGLPTKSECRMPDTAPCRQ